MVTVFEVVGEPRRREILEQLLVGDCTVGALTDALGVSQPSVSKHLRVLRDAGLVSVRVDAQRRVYRLRPEPLKELDSWLAPYRRIWDERLDALERRLDEMED